MIYFVVALACEAKPLIRVLNLKSVANHANYPLYENDRFRLIVTGIGKLNAATATSYLASLSEIKKNNAWLNVGIAGHLDADIGSPFLANKIIDGGSGLSWYPIFIRPFAVKSTSLVTQDHAQNKYEPNTLYDMEAAGFYLAASRFNTTEFVHSLKIVSDNQTSPAGYLPEKEVSQLIASNIEIIEQTALHINESAQQWQRISETSPDFDKFLARWHFTVYQQNSLKQLLKRWKTLLDDQSIWNQDITNLADAKQVLRYIQQKLKQSTIQLESPAKIK